MSHAKPENLSTSVVESVKKYKELKNKLDVLKSQFIELKASKQMYEMRQNEILVELAKLNISTDKLDEVILQLETELDVLLQDIVFEDFNGPKL